jgi:hypothetical protein
MKANNKDTINLIENLPRLIQTINTLKQFPDELLKDKLSLEEIDAIRSIDLNNKRQDDKCLPIPSLDVFESEVQAIEISKGILVFALYSKQLMNRHPSISIGDIIQIKVRTYIDLRNGKTLIPFQSNRQYTPKTINFSITNYDWESNLGTARGIGPVAKLLLVDEANVIHEHSLSNIGDRIGVNIEEIYLMK